MAAKGTIQSWVEFAGAQSVLGILGSLPDRSAKAIGRGVARGIFTLLSHRLDAGRKNLHFAFPEKTDGEREEILRRSIENIGYVIAEVAQLRRARAADLERMIDWDFSHPAFDDYRRAKAEGRGVILPTAHIGNWELLVASFSGLYEPIHFIARTLDNTLMEQMFHKHRSRFGSFQLEKSDSARAILRILRSGGSVGVLPDVNTLANEGVFVPFFGIPACTTSGVALFALRTNAVILPMFSVRQEDGRYRVVHGRTIEASRTGNRERDVIETTAAYTAEIEKIVRAYPEQWLWIHKRWKTRPAGQRGLYQAETRQ